jgi:hypothetical protein
MHVVLRPAGDQMLDTRARRGPAVVDRDGIDLLAHADEVTE